MNSPQAPQDRDRVDVHPPTYPMLARVVRYGDQVSVALAVVVLAVGTFWAWQSSSLMLALLTWAGAAAVYALARVGVELVRLVCDMLLPK